MKTKAFDYNGIDYLLKPISREALERALSRCEKHFPRADTGTLKKPFEGISFVITQERKKALLIALNGND